MTIPENIDPRQLQEAAEHNFISGYNCCQSVLLAFADMLPLGKEELLSLGSGFGGGMARMREVCGTVSAMTMVAGFILPAIQPSDMDARTANYALVQEFAAKFKEKRGSIVCRELLCLRKACAAETGVESPRPSERTPDYYRTRPCAALVGTAAYILAEYLKSMKG